jgi:hypothetical protein
MRDLLWWMSSRTTDPGSLLVIYVSMALQLDPFQRVVNVSWGGLAVIFGETDQDAPPKEAWPK